MRNSSIKTGKQSRVTYDVLEEMVRLKVQEFIEDILEEEIARVFRSWQIRED